MNDPTSTPPGIADSGSSIDLSNSLSCACPPDRSPPDTNSPSWEGPGSVRDELLVVFAADTWFVGVVIPE